MKAGIAAGVAAALLLLTWLLLRGLAVDQRPFDTAMQLLDEVELAEAMIRRDLLSARAGLLRDYDPLVRAGRQVEAAVARLRAFTTPEQADRLEAWRLRQERLVEASKSDNALLRNSLAQVGRLTVRLSAPPGGGVPVAEAGRLGSAILHLTLDTSALVLDEVRRGLADLQLQAVPESERGPAAALLAHGALLQDLLPRVDGLLRDLQSHASAPVREAIAAEVEVRREAAEAAARRYRLLLYASAVLLLGGLLLLGMRLSARALAMRRHAAFEHMLARLSARLIGTGLSEAEAGVSHALEEIAQRLGAQRAYLATAGQAGSAHVPAAHVWTTDGATPPEGWPEAVLALANRHPPSPQGTIRLPPGHPDLRDIPGGLHAWMAAVRRTEDGVAVLLGCDLTRPSRLPSEQELGSLGLALDAVLNLITRSRLEAERSRLAAQDARSRQMEMLGTFASGIAHNFNNIIGAILGFTEMAQAGSSGARLADIRRAAERARDLASDILAFGGRQPTPQGEVEVEALLAETEALLRVMLPPDVRLTVGLPSESVMVSGDATRIQQVIVNLCRNAAQAMEGPGEVVIEVERRALHEKRALRLGELRPDHYLIIRVSDTGPGMDATTLGRIFEPFFTTRRAGHGLGLATAGEIVLAHGGGMAVRSTPGQGSCFEVWLPRAVAAEAMRREMPRGEGEAVLVLYDDDRLHREEELLAVLGYEPHGFRAVTSALAALHAVPRRFDAALLPEGSAEIARKVRRVAPALPIILAATTPVSGFDCIGWPLASDELATALRRCLARPTLPA
ncbi:two-component system VirA-like sensor kinase [Falsiroseomonas selenitidurans]|uniref:histidine kinase n=1 Tax=Falsiroseomonas selenitidurans TaxID=2716335 RepID=A0ABX1E888_9PROT|nr:two-component system VirA-like sensor kinase [Falsiroseomonas selenitidurans]NKC31105.1 two-component system VirA-like sensor kinase [Falsiroseomonas selenitidurans]